MTSGLTRRAVVGLPLVVATALIAASDMAAGQDKVLRVKGEVTAENYRALAALLFASLDTVVGLEVSFKASDGFEDGKLSAYKDGDLFLAYVPGPDNDSQISAGNGYTLADGNFVFDGFYKVVYGGIGQGIQAISLEKANWPAGKPIEEIDIAALKAPGN